MKILLSNVASPTIITFRAERVGPLGDSHTASGPTRGFGHSEWAHSNDARNEWAHSIRVNWRLHAGVWSDE